MGKKVIVSEKVLKSLLMEMAKERIALNEIKAELAYTRFYEGKIDRETYAKIMAGSKNMTPFHKRVLDIICSYEGELPPDIQQLPELAQKAWNKSELGRQFLLNAISMDAYCVKNGISMFYFLQRFILMERFSETEYYKDGLVKLFENDKLLVTATLSYAASQKYYGDSHWCTASGIDGIYDGWKMYGEYTEDDQLLLQFVDKSRREHSYQAQYEYDIHQPHGYPMRTGQICDFNDNGVNQEELIRFLTEMGVDYYELMASIDFRELQSLASKLNRDESDYWNIRVPYYEKKMWAKVGEKFKTEEFLRKMHSCLLNEINDEDATPFYFEEKINRSGLNNGIRVFNVELELYDEDELNNLGVFDQNEMNFFSRVANSGDDIEGLASWVLIVKDNNNATVLNKIDGWAKTYIGNVVVIGDQGDIAPYNVATGKQLFKKDPAVTTFDNDTENVYFGYRIAWNEVKPLYKVDINTLEVEKVSGSH